MADKPLDQKVVVITGAAGLLGRQHAEATAQAGAHPVLLDLHLNPLEELAGQLKEKYGIEPLPWAADITHKPALDDCLAEIRKTHGRVDGLINNAANNPKMEAEGDTGWMRLESLPLEAWNQDLAVGLTGAFLCAQVFGSAMAGASGGAIVNIASDLSLIGPDQRLYRQPGLADAKQPVKPVTYSVVKTGLIGLTRYLATYWAQQGVRVNAISPGGIANDQPAEFVEKLTELIPMKRMAQPGEYRDAIVFLLSDSSSYMTGANLVIDGGRTAW